MAWHFEKVFQSYKECQLNSIQLSKEVVSFWLEQNKMVVQSVSDFLEMLMNQVEESQVTLKVPSPEEFNQLFRQNTVLTVLPPDTSLLIDQTLSRQNPIWPDFLKAPQKIQASNKESFLDWLVLYLDRF